MANKDKMKETLHSCKEWILNHSKIVLPVVVAVCVVITVAVALTANKNKTERQTVGAETVTEESSSSAMVIPEDPFEVDAYPEINEFINRYFALMAEGDAEGIEAMYDYMNDSEKIYISEISQYIENYPSIEVYTKKGPEEDSMLAYVYYYVKFQNYDNIVPGVQTFYVCKKDDGSYYFKTRDENDEAIKEYMAGIALQDDVEDLKNKVNVEYKDLRASDSALDAFLTELESQIQISVGEVLAAEQESVQTEETTEGTEAETEAGTEIAENGEGEAAQNTIQTMRATDVVNIRSSDSETADRLGKAQIGDTFKVLENKVNGWSRVEYNGGEAYIRSDYLELVSEEPASEEGGEEAAEEEAGSSGTIDASDGYITAKETVNIRSGQSETSERVGVAYKGEKLELIMELADGWCKIKYNGETAYVKSDYVE